MVANIRGYTPNYNFKLINFDTPRWHTLEYANWNYLDGLFSQLGTPPVRGEWLNSTTYIVGDRVFEQESGDLYRCLVQHTSAPTGSFAEDRANNPSYWTVQVLGVPLFRDQWTTDTVYALGDIIFIDEYRYYLCTLSHTSTDDFLDDEQNWAQIFDATAAVDDAAQSATDAAQSATDAAASAVDSEESAQDAAQSASLAASVQSAFLWLYDSNVAMADPGIGKYRVNNANPLAITQLALSSQSNDFGNPNLTSWIITWDDSTTLNSRGTVYLRRTDAPENFIIFTVNGPVQDNGTWQMVSVTTSSMGGVIDHGLSTSIAFVRTGNSGTTGVGSGDMLAANNLSDVEDPAEAADNIGVGATDTPTFVQVHVGAPTVDDNAATKLYVDGAGADITSAYEADDAAIIAAYGAADTTLQTNVNNKVSKLAAGDTMLGNLSINKVGPQFTLDKTAGDQASNINGAVNGTMRWVMQLGNESGESGANAGSNWTVVRFSDAGAYLGTALFIDRATGKLTLEGDPVTSNHAANKNYVDTKAPLASPVFTGDPKAPTPGVGDNDTSIATTAFVASSIERATTAEYVANSAPTKLLTSAAIWGAGPAINLTDAASVAINMASGIDFLWSIGAPGRTMANPTAGKPGQKGLIFILPNATGTITTWGGAWLFAGNTKPVFAPNTINIIQYVLGGDGLTTFCTVGLGYG